MDKENSFHKFSKIGVLVAIGIVFGDIGTSPLYVMKAVLGASAVMPSVSFIKGILSCIIWTLTLQTTVKYVFIALRADNNGEGGILALYSLVKNKKRKSLYIIAIIGAAALVSDGVITPPMTVLSAVEGLRLYNSTLNVVNIALIIIILLFILQQFGTQKIGKLFGPIMVLWFLTIAVLGATQIAKNWTILEAFNPYYAVNFLIHSPKTMLIVGAIFLCTTGAEALYSDLGHCGIKNIRMAWFYVKICLILNYLGQGAWIIAHPHTAMLETANPFFAIMPDFFLIPGIIISTFAAVIASQALISGTFTLFSEAMSLNFWPRQRIDYPELNQGQKYIPVVNWGMLAICIIIVLYFQSSSRMEAAYGFAITITMTITTILLINYFMTKNINKVLIICFAAIYITIEIGFFFANALKFTEGGWIAILLATIITLTMYIWRNGRRIKNKYTKFIKIKPYIPVIQDMKADESIPKYATNLVYISNAKRNDDIDAKIIYSMINKRPKRADHYWFLALQYDSNPYTFEYEITDILPDTITKITFILGYKVEPLLNLYFRQILEKLQSEGKFDSISRFESLKKHNVAADFEYVVIDRIFSLNSQTFSAKERLMLRLYEIVKHIGISDEKAYGLEHHSIVHEYVPMQQSIKTKICN